MKVKLEMLYEIEELLGGNFLFLLKIKKLIFFQTI